MEKKQKLDLDAALEKIAARLRPEPAYDNEQAEELLTSNWSHGTS